MKFWVVFLTLFTLAGAAEAQNINVVAARSLKNKKIIEALVTDPNDVTAPVDLKAGTTLNGSPITGGGETNTASNLGGGLANWDSKSSADLRFNSFDAADFDLGSNLLTIDATKWLTISAAAAAYRPIESCIRADATRVLTSTTAEQALFNDPANGRITVGTGTYLFRGRFYLSGMSATSGNAAIDPLGAGTATATAWLWQVIGVDNTNAAVTTTRTGQNVITQQTNASALSAAAGTAMLAEFSGTVEITGAGTMIPSVSLVTAATPTLGLGSYFCIERIGSTTMTSVGAWD